MKHIVTLEEFLERLKAKHGDSIEYVSGYKNTKTKCMFRCKIDGHTWFAIPNSILNGSGCPICGKLKNIKKRTTTLDRMKERVKEVWGDSVEYICGYTKLTKKCWWKCTICGNIWMTTPSNLLNKEGCPECKKVTISKKLTIPLEKIKERVKEIWGDLIEYISGYKNTSTKCKWRCTLDGYEWEAKPNDILQKHGCPLCAKCAPVTLEEAKQRVKEISNGTIEIVNPEDYVNTTSYLKFKCLIDGCVWEAWIYDVFRGASTCPMCKRYSMEKPILEALKNKGITPIHNKGLKGCYYEGGRKLIQPDFIIETPKGKMAIEADGRQHFFPMFGQPEENLKIIQDKDRYKDKILKEKEYILIRVTSSPTKEWGFKNHIALKELLDLIEIGIDSKTGEINFELFRKYDFNRE